MIDTIVSTSSPTSDTIAGGDLGVGAGRAQNMEISVQVFGIAPGSYEVHLEAAIVPRGGAVEFTKIGEFRNTDDAKLSIFPVSMGAQYRFQHISGVATRVRLAG